MSKEKIEGLRGWLIFPIIALFLSIFTLIISIILVNVMPEFNPFGIIFSFLYGFLWIFVVIVLVSIFKKKKYVPKIMIIFYVATTIINLSAGFLIRGFGIWELIRSIISIIVGVVWILYFIRSKRVKNTFVN